jgi:hypothetical protein
VEIALLALAAWLGANALLVLLFCVLLLGTARQPPP